PARRAAAPMVWARIPSSSRANPSSSTKPAERKSGTAPVMATSLTVPLTARSPRFPPGKKRGRTTNESVLKASRAAPACTTAASPSWARMLPVPPKAGRKRCSISSAPSRPPPPWPITMVGWSRRGTGQDQFCGSRGVVVPPVAPSAARQCRPVEAAELVVGRTGSLARHHGGPEGRAGGAPRAEGLALWWGDVSLEHFAAAAPGRLLGHDAPHVEALLGIELCEGRREAP